MATTAQRHHLLALMDFLYHHRAQLDYPPHDVRGALDARTFRMTEQTMEHVINSGGRLMADCSEMVTELLRWVGCKDPNGLGYRYAGYTGTLLASLPHYEDPKKAGIGALAVFGPGNGEHVSMVHTPDPKGGNPLMASHGRPGYDLIHLQAQASFHSKPVRLLSIAHL